MVICSSCSQVDTELITKHTGDSTAMSLLVKTVQFVLKRKCYSMLNSGCG